MLLLPLGGLFSFRLRYFVALGSAVTSFVISRIWNFAPSPNQASVCSHGI